MITEIGFNHVGRRANFHGESSRVKFRNHHATAKEAEIATLLTGRAIGIGFGDFCEVGTVCDLVLERVDFGKRFILGAGRT